MLIDAPCSGTGTWRRNPEARWRLTPARIERLVDTQRRLLSIAAPLVKPGGALVYIVCSLLDEEGAGQIDALPFGPSRLDRRAADARSVAPRGAGRRLTPAHDATDGFFVARLVRAMLADWPLCPSLETIMRLFPAALAVSFAALSISTSLQRPARR